MNWSQNRLLLLVSLLLVVSAGVFAVGSVAEHAQRSGNKTELTGGHSEGSSETGGASGHTEAGASDQHKSSEDIAGVNPESWPAVAAAVAASLLLAAAVYRRRSARWLLAAAAFGVLFAAGDVRELIHQLNESRTAVATIAGVLIALHLLVTATAAATLTRGRTTASSP